MSKLLLVVHSCAIRGKHWNNNQNKALNSILTMLNAELLNIFATFFFKTTYTYSTVKLIEKQLKMKIEQKTIRVTTRTVSSS